LKFSRAPYLPRPNTVKRKTPAVSTSNGTSPKPTLQAAEACVTLWSVMLNLKKFLPLFVLPFLLIGCATSTITNLTPSRLPRKDNGQYALAVEWDSRQQSLIRDSIKASVVVGLDQYPMQRTLMLTNRWETLVPVPADNNVVTYRYRFDYEYRGCPTHQLDSKLSKYYQLFILDK